jgi:DNA-binding CsgD family transcriptional regulator
MGTILANSAGEKGHFGRLAPVAVVGIGESMRQQLKEFTAQWENRPFAEAGAADPGFKVVYEEFARQRWVTVSRAEIADKLAAASSPAYRELRGPLESDDVIVSVRFVDVPKRVEAIDVHRAVGATPFGPREVALMKLLHDEIAPLVGVRLATEDHLCREGLSKRLRETLTLLLEGRSEKEVAAAMEIGTRTVHDYVTALYDHFQVNSRSELLAYFIRRQPILRERS